MPWKSPRVCECGRRVAGGLRCPCQLDRDRARKARHDAKRPNASQRGYDAKWERARRDFLKMYPTCARCGAPATVVDHVIPHKGDKRLFWDRTLWQPLCAHHHNSSKQREERAYDHA